MSKTDSSIAMRALKGNLNIEADVYNGKGKKKERKEKQVMDRELLKSEG